MLSLPRGSVGYLTTVSLHSPKTTAGDPSNIDDIINIIQSSNNGSNNHRSKKRNNNSNSSKFDSTTIIFEEKEEEKKFTNPIELQNEISNSLKNPELMFEEIKLLCNACLIHKIEWITVHSMWTKQTCEYVEKLLKKNKKKKK